MKCFFKICALSVALLLSLDVKAQHFGTMPETPAEKPSAGTADFIPPNPKAIRSQTAPVSAAQNAPKEQKQPEENLEDNLDTPSAFEVRFIGNDVIFQDKPKILLYMRDFKITRGMGNEVSCNMRFYVRAAMPDKISDISYRLKWPEIETALSFNDVAAGQAMYYDYSLLGKGCYSMDKAPNITINRCRVKGLSQKDCAALVEWAN